jgi:hypothetical protein
MSTDLPIFTLPTFDLTDQAARRLGFYVRGQLGKLDYRAILANPFPITTSGATNLPSGNPVSPNSNFTTQGNHLQYQGLFIWNFLEKEPHVLPFTAGTYYGARNILNLEAGFITQKNATWSSQDSGITVDYHALHAFCLAVFYDAPINHAKGTAVSGYLGYFKTDFGPRYIRYLGVMNPADGLVPSPTYYAGSQGNALPMYGTGHIVYGQAGFLLPRNILGANGGRLEPYLAVMSATYDRLDKMMTLFNLGINWQLSGNTSKLSFDYQNRPVYTLVSGNLTRGSAREGQFVIQYQFFF